MSQATQPVSRQASTQVAAPQAGRNVNVAPATQMTLEFDPTTSNFERVDNNLVISSDNGGSVTVTDFFVTGGQSLPQFVMSDNAVVAGEDLLKQLNPDMDISTAAGPSASASSSGAGDYADNAGDLLGGVDKYGKLGTVFWGQGAEAPELVEGVEVPFADFSISIISTIPENPEDPDGRVTGTFVNTLFEDSRPNQHLDGPGSPREYGVLDLNITTQGTTFVTGLDLSGFRADTIIEIVGGRSITITGPGQIVSLTPAEINAEIRVYAPEDNSDADMGIQAILYLSTAAGTTGSVPFNFTLVVDAVADRPEELAAGKEDTTNSSVSLTEDANVDQEFAHGWATDNLKIKDATPDGSEQNITSKITVSAIFSDYGEDDRNDVGEKHYLLVEAKEGWKCVDNNGNEILYDKVTLYVGDNGRPLDAQVPGASGKTAEFFKIPMDNADLLANGGVGEAELTISRPLDAMKGDDGTVDLYVGAMAHEDSPTDREATENNNIAVNFPTGPQTVTIDVVNSNLQVRLGWASEGNDNDKFLHTPGADHADYKPKFEGMSDGIAGNEDAEPDVRPASTNDLGAPMTFSLKEAGTSLGTDDKIESVKVSYKVDGPDSLPGQFVDANGNPLDVTVTGDDASGYTATVTFPDPAGTYYFQPTAGSHSDGEIDLSYTVVVKNGTDASATFSGKTVVVVDAVADKGAVDIGKPDYTPGVDDNREFALPGETVKISGAATVYDLDGSETPFLLLNVPEHWRTGLTLDDKTGVVAALRGVGGNAVPDGSFGGIANSDGYLLLKLEPAEGRTAWTLADGGSASKAGNVITYEFACGAKVTLDTGTGEATYKLSLKAPAVADIPADELDSLKETLGVQVVTVEKGAAAPHELDFRNNVAVSDAAGAELEVRGEVHVNLLPGGDVDNHGKEFTILESDASPSMTWKLALTNADGSPFAGPLFADLKVTVNLPNFGTPDTPGTPATFGADFTFDWTTLKTALDAQNLGYDYDPATGKLTITFPEGYDPADIGDLPLTYTVVNDHLTEHFSDAASILEGAGLTYAGGTAVLDVDQTDADKLRAAIEAKYAGVHGDNEQYGLPGTESFGPKIDAVTGTGYTSIDELETVGIKDGIYNNLDKDGGANDGYFVNITADGTDVLEGSDAVFTVTLTGADGQPAPATQDTIIILKLSGSGEDGHKATIGGADSDIKGSEYKIVVIPAGQTTAKVTIGTVADTLPEGTKSDPFEGFSVSIEGTYGNETTIGKGSADMKIMEPGTTHVWLEAVSKTSVTEGADKTVTFTLMFSKNDLTDHAGKIFVSLTGATDTGHGHGYATPGVDFTVEGGEVHNGAYGVWVDYDNTKVDANGKLTFKVSIVDDDVVEGPEVFSAKIADIARNPDSNYVGAIVNPDRIGTEGNAGQLDVTINDNDKAVINLWQEGAAGKDAGATKDVTEPARDDEGKDTDTGANLLVTIDKPVAEDVTVKVTIGNAGNSADLGDDYSAVYKVGDKLTVFYDDGSTGTVEVKSVDTTTDGQVSLTFTIPGHGNTAPTGANTITGVQIPVRVNSDDKLEGKESFTAKVELVGTPTGVSVGNATTTTNIIDGCKIVLEALTYDADKGEWVAFTGSLNESNPNIVYHAYLVDANGNTLTRADGVTFTAKAAFTGIVGTNGATDNHITDFNLGAGTKITFGPNGEAWFGANTSAGRDVKPANLPADAEYTEGVVAIYDDHLNDVGKTGGDTDSFELSLTGGAVNGNAVAGSDSGTVKTEITDDIGDNAEDRDGPDVNLTLGDAQGGTLYEGEMLTAKMTLVNHGTTDSYNGNGNALEAITITFKLTGVTAANFTLAPGITANADGTYSTTLLATDKTTFKIGTVGKGVTGVGVEVVSTTGNESWAGKGDEITAKVPPVLSLTGVEELRESDGRQDVKGDGKHSGNVAKYTLELDEAYDRDATVTMTITGSGADKASQADFFLQNGGDVGSTSNLLSWTNNGDGSITIKVEVPAGQTSVDFGLRLNDDDSSEPTEQYTVKITGVADSGTSTPSLITVDSTKDHQDTRILEDGPSVIDDKARNTTLDGPKAFLVPQNTSAVEPLTKWDDGKTGEESLKQFLGDKYQESGVYTTENIPLNSSYVATFTLGLQDDSGKFFTAHESVTFTISLGDSGGQFSGIVLPSGNGVSSTYTPGASTFTVTMPANVASFGFGLIAAPDHKDDTGAVKVELVGVNGCEAIVDKTPDSKVSTSAEATISDERDADNQAGGPRVYLSIDKTDGDLKSSTGTAEMTVNGKDESIHGKGVVVEPTGAAKLVTQIVGLTEPADEDVVVTVSFKQIDLGGSGISYPQVTGDNVKSLGDGVYEVTIKQGTSSTAFEVAVGDDNSDWNQWVTGVVTGVKGGEAVVGKNISTELTVENSDTGTGGGDPINWTHVHLEAPANDTFAEYWKNPGEHPDIPAGTVVFNFSTDYHDEPTDSPECESVTVSFRLEGAAGLLLTGDGQDVEAVAGQISLTAGGLPFPGTVAVTANPDGSHTLSITYNPSDVGAATVSVGLPIVNDKRSEGTEDLVVTLESVKADGNGGASIGGEDGHGVGVPQNVLHVIDGDPNGPQVTIGTVSDTVDEGDNAYFRVYFDEKPDTEDVRVELKYADGDAKSGTDYTPVTYSVIFKPGDTWKQDTNGKWYAEGKDVAVPTNIDNVYDPNEKFSLELQRVYGNETWFDATGSSASVTIIDTVPPTITLSSSAATVNEGSDMTFTVKLEGSVTDKPVTVELTLTGKDTGAELADWTFKGLDAKYNATYDPATGKLTLTIPAGETSVPVRFTAVDDTHLENAEKFSMKITGADCNGTDLLKGTAAENADVSINGDTVTASIKCAGVTSLTEGSDDSFSFTLTLSEANPDGTTSVMIKPTTGFDLSSLAKGAGVVSITDKGNGNYEVVLERGVTSGTFSVKPEGQNTLITGNKAASISVVTGGLTEGDGVHTAGGVAVKPAGGAAGVTVVDDDVPTVSLGVLPATVNEGGDLSLSLTLDKAIAVGNNPLVVTLTLSGAASKADFGTLPDGVAWSGNNLQITIPAGTAAGSLAYALPILKDSLVEGTEALKFTITSAKVGSVNAGVGANNAETTIVDGDSCVVSLVQPTADFTEGEAPFTLNLTTKVDAAITVTMKLTGGTVSAADLGGVTVNGDGTFTFTIPANTPAGNYKVPGVTFGKDNLVEGIETGIFQLVSAVSTGDRAVSATVGSHEYTVKDGDSATISFGAATASGKEGESASIALTRTGANLQADSTTTLTFKLAGGTATIDDIDLTKLGTGLTYDEDTGRFTYVFTGNTPGSIALPLKADGIVEGPETFTLQLVSAVNSTGGAVNTGTGTVAVTIKDIDKGDYVANPDQLDVFVQVDNWGNLIVPGGTTTVIGDLLANDENRLPGGSETVAFTAGSSDFGAWSVDGHGNAAYTLDHSKIFKLDSGSTLQDTGSYTVHDVNSTDSAGVKAVIHAVNNAWTDGDDTITGAQSVSNALYGGDGNDVITAGNQGDSLYGGAGNDTIHGGAGNDTIHGGTGDDVIYGGLGNNELWGDAGNDIFAWQAGSYGGSDTIMDFTVGQDMLRFDDLLDNGTTLDDYLGNNMSLSADGKTLTFSVDSGQGVQNVEINFTAAQSTVLDAYNSAGDEAARAAVLTEFIKGLTTS